MRKLMGLVCGAALLAGAGAALARGFTVSDFGAVPNDPTCIDKGRRLFERYGTRSVKTTDWTVNAYAVGRDETIDAAIACAYGPNGKTQVTLVIHSFGDGSEDSRRSEMAKELRRIWEGL